MKDKKEKTVPKFGEETIQKYKNNLAVNIKKEREKRGWSQARLGKLISIQGKQISNYENGITIPPMNILFILCNIFECEPGYLLGDPVYADGTTLKTAISENTGLNKKAIDAFEHIIATEPQKSTVGLGYKSETVRKIINMILESDYFPVLLNCLVSLDEVSNLDESVWKNIYDKYDKETINNALYVIDYDPVSEETINIESSQQLENAIKDIDSAMAQSFSNPESNIPLARFRVDKAFETFIDRLYPESVIDIRPPHRSIN